MRRRTPARDPSSSDATGETTPATVTDDCAAEPTEALETGDRVGPPTSTPRARSTSPTTRCRPGARRSGASRRSSGCAACTRTPPLRAGAPRPRRRRGADGRRRRQLGAERRRRAARAATCPATGSRPGPGRPPRRRCTVVTVPAEAVVEEPTIVAVTGAGVEPAPAPAHPCSSAERARQRDGRARRSSGSAALADNIESCVGDGATHRRVSIQDWDDDAVHVSQHDARVGRDATYGTWRLVRRRPRPAERHRAVRRTGRRGRDARPVLRRRRPAPRAPAVRRPQRAARPAATSTTRARCRARARTPCGSATC